MKQFISSYQILVTLLLSESIFGFRCDRRPYGSTTQASSADGRFKLSVLDTEDSYIPDQLYTVQISDTDGESRFTSFVISAEGDSRPDPRNPRRLVTLYPGELRPMTTRTAKFSDRCLYSVEQAAISLKSSVEVYWQAPPPDNGCVTFRAMVAENEEVWFEDGRPLTVRLCEDQLQPDDVAPQLNLDCRVCDDAKYEVSFTGVWSRNTHPLQYPENDWLPKFGELVGASHSAELVLWAPGTLATPGLRDLAEHANSSVFESELREKIGNGVRTIIKGRGHKYPQMKLTTHAVFRADKTHHLLTTAVGISPSPDWFLGVTRFELCQEGNTWLPSRELNLYPWDAGTDSGVSYESANIETFPQDAITRVQMSSYDKNSPFFETDMKDMHPFGKLSITLMRTYHRDCEEPTDEGGSPGEQEGGNAAETVDVEPDEPSRYHNPDLPSSNSGRETPPVDLDPEAPEDCPLTQWTEWSPCEGRCLGDRISGYRWRERYHLVDGEAVEKYDGTVKSTDKVVPEECKEKYEDFQTEACSEGCVSDSITASRRLPVRPIAPGQPWHRRRELNNV